MNKAIIILIILLSLGCAKNNSEQNQLNLSTESTAVIPLKYVIVNIDKSLVENTYSAKFGSQDIILAKLSEFELIFNVPDVNTGSHSLQLEINGEKGNLDFDLSENLVQNSDQIIDSELINPLNSLKLDIDDLLTTNTLSAELVTSLVSANQLLDDYLTKFNTLSETEKIKVAKFYNANPFFTSDFLNQSTLSIHSGNSDFDCFNVNSKRVIYTTVTVLGFVAALPHLTAAGPLGSIAALSGFIAGVYAAHSIISAAHELLINDCFLPIEHALNDDLGNSDGFEMENNYFLNFNIISTSRHIISSDISSSNTAVAFTLEKIKLVTVKWSNLTNGINSLFSNSSNWFNSWFSSSTSSTPLITYEFPDIPSNSIKQENDGKSEFISVEDFPSDIDVQVNINGINSISLKLDADENTLPRTVTGKIRYNDGDFTTVDNFSVVLGDTIPCSDMTPPILSNFQLVCGTNGVDAMVDFIADGTGIFTSSSHSGWCDETLTCYPVRLYSWDPNNPTTTYAITFNGYSYSLVSGDKNSGTIAIHINQTADGCNNGDSAAQSLEDAFAVNPIYWKIELMNKCNQRSNQIIF